MKLEILKACKIERQNLKKGETFETNKKVLINYLQKKGIAKELIEISEPVKQVEKTKK